MNPDRTQSVVAGRMDQGTAARGALEQWPLGGVVLPVLPSAVEQWLALLPSADRTAHLASSSAHELLFEAE